MRRAFVAGTWLLSLLTVAAAQDQGFTADRAGATQPDIPNNVYTLLLFPHLAYNTFPSGSVISTPTDFAFVAPRAGIVRFSGQVRNVIDQTEAAPPINPAYVVKISKNAPCGKGDVFASIGTATGAWWVNAIPVQGEDLAEAGDVYRWCIHATAGVGNTSYIEGHPAHTRISVSMSGP